MSGAPRVSVLIPTHNHGRYLPEAVESVLRQDFRDIEVIISDDGSTDGTPAILAHYAALDPRVIPVVHPTGLGQAGNANFCLSRARGELVKFVYADDRLVTADALGRMVAALDAAPGAVMAACVVPPLEVTRARSTSGGSADACASAVAPWKVASASRRACCGASPISAAACIMASTKKNT